MVSPTWHFFNLFICVPLILCPWNLCTGIVIDGLIWEHDDHWFGNSHLNRSSLERCHRLQYLLDMKNPSRPQEWPEVIRDNHEATSNKSNNYLNWYKSDRKEKIPKNKKKKIIRKSNRLPLKMLKGFTVSLCYPSWVKKNGPGINWRIHQEIWHKREPHFESLCAAYIKYFIWTRKTLRVYNSLMMITLHGEFPIVSNRWSSLVSLKECE